ncbi:phenylalanine--tRNA ligase subunit alpha [Bacillus horti]|uniref:Phenylalanine--tRNA ligase alpha subunit n=1 Tax=Caldalkalibacillus horti TaxID=77523 RepID=A0ABT9VWP4_9BACI|nr:phenylalanine--tRNA ligase subunit alpha [Bacillus horti]MDQ0165389.1 phenylalanyl-tRNA synthetase alpha chain [Bacillus horti]
MKDKLLALKEEAIQKATKAQDMRAVQDVKVEYLGKKGPITEVLRGMGQLSAEERPLMGQLVNEVRNEIEEALTSKVNELEAKLLEDKLATETIDVTLPGRPVKAGSTHPLTQVVEQIEDIFLGMGFKIAEGPEVETDYFNFELLNLPKNHPARDMQDSFYITEDILLRTQTSPVQARAMQEMKGEVPVKIICPGKVFRRDDDDATHSHQFMQIEGLYIDRDISMSDLKGTLLTFAKEMFSDDQNIRLRPSFFPFTEPSVEVDISCILCSGKGCRVCKHTGWIEILGAGMVHPNVLEMSGYDSKTYTGFAFGMGVERIAMLKYGIDDIRHFYTNDARFLKQFQRM